jgi:hypothetical protein
VFQPATALYLPCLVCHKKFTPTGGTTYGVRPLALASQRPTTRRPCLTDSQAKKHVARSFARLGLSCATAEGQGAEINRPRDSDLIAAADRLLDRAYGKSAPDRSPPGFVGSYDLDKLTNEQLHTVTSILKLAPEGAVGDTD